MVVGFGEVEGFYTPPVFGGGGGFGVWAGSGGVFYGFWGTSFFVAGLFF